ncbi:uncharacterized protein LOC126558659 [Anopheles maculipalpis]|uniref:uncharacterized protein LOC126558659 n=1 Tax=Anopheles maculipalpis TaxID=1496333 RepID=UPI002159B058|nr:uncharacterized protein LOC126558659 [Anopheles maculipalpis]
MIYVIFTTESWDLLFTSSSQYIEKGLDILLKIPIALVVFIPWIILMRKPQIASLSRDLAVFDKLMAKCNYPHNYQLLHIIAAFFAATNVLIPLIILAALRGFDFWADHFLVLGFVGYSWSGGLLFNTTFNILLFHILYRIEVVNDLLRDLLQTNCSQNSVVETLEKIKTITRMHDKLGDIANNCAKCFAISIVLTMLHVLISEILTIFAFVRALFYHHDVDELQDCIFYILGTTSYCTMPIATIWIAGDMKKRTVVTSKLIHRIINTTNVVEIEDLLQQFSEQMNHRSPSIDFRLFDVGWPLLVKACSEAATYLIIMIQFDTKQ